MRTHSESSSLDKVLKQVRTISLNLVNDLLVEIFGDDTILEFTESVFLKFDDEKVVLLLLLMMSMKSRHQHGSLEVRKMVRDSLHRDQS